MHDRCRGAPGGPSYLRGLSGGTAPRPQHRPRPALAAPGQPDNGPGAERSPAGSGTAPPRSAPAPTAWRGTAGPGVPAGRLLAGSARKCGQRYLRREFDLSRLMSRLGGVALPRTAPSPASLPEPPGPRRNPRPAGGGNDSRLEASIAAAAATHRAAGATARRLCGPRHGGKLRQPHGSGQLGLARKTHVQRFFLAMQLLLILCGMA